ncbi:MAG TPA: ABC transporter permease [Actinomycetota bacterium]|nr:ABC transporter permease [Actinomycetota bacterium]
MRPRLVLAGALMRRHVVELSRYAFDSVVVLLMTYVLFLVVFFGAKSIGGNVISRADTLSSIVLGFLIWALVAFAYSDISQGIIQEAQAGTLEQLAMTPAGLSTVLMMNSAVMLISHVLQMSVVLVLAMWTSGRWLEMDIVSIAPLLFMTLMGVVGVGLAIGGAALVFKRVAGVSSLLQLAFVGLIVAPLDQIPALALLPLTLGYDLLNQVMVDGVWIGDIAPRDILFLFLNSVAYILIGLGAFRGMERIARGRGLLGHY